ncbi:hypothetical protein BRC86_01560 [Halobacteriales archaeon QS_3_64_16]|nr:MAG: hypothetical protein BRC86_01560 [Halobacteriales archaeon QS_3_64_16]
MTDSTDPARTEETAEDRPASNQNDETDDSDRSPRSEHSDQDHFQGVEDGCGCTEVWEHLSEQREKNRNADPTPATEGD